MTSMAEMRYSAEITAGALKVASYALGCMMGRYILDMPGLIYAHGGNVGFDPSQYKTFPAKFGDLPAEVKAVTGGPDDD